jgi:2-dehydropantoate 2-reductase
MNILIFGAGAIGCHIAYCMYEAGHTVNLICRGKHYDQMKKHGMKIHIYDNEVLNHEKIIEEDSRLKIVNNLSKIKGTEFDYIFITVKLSNYNEETLESLQPFMGEDTAVIPPCTKMPFWWFYNLGGNRNTKYNDIDFDPILSKYFNRENIIMMTMWLSAVIDRPGHVIIKHVQRGYPLGALYPKMNDHGKKLRDIFSATCLSPLVEDIRSEIFLKSINSLAFNAVALDKEFNNLQLSQDEDSKTSIKKIMLEGEKILNALNLPVIQDVDDRIRQTLSSTKHTMSMLHDYQTGRTVELAYVWDGFDRISKILGIRMDFTKQLCERVLSKINSLDTPLLHSANS